MDWWLLMKTFCECGRARLCTYRKHRNCAIYTGDLQTTALLTGQTAASTDPGFPSARRPPELTQGSKQSPRFTDEGAAPGTGLNPTMAGSSRADNSSLFSRLRLPKPKLNCFSVLPKDQNGAGWGHLARRLKCLQPASARLGLSPGSAPGPASS